MNKGISGIIAVKDNPPHIDETIDSITQLVDEIVIADIGMEKTLLLELKKNKQIRIVTIKKAVPYVELIREELKSYANGAYILFMDPDETVPQALAQTIDAMYQHYDFIKIPRKNIIFGKWIRHSRWWPDYQVRLFKKNAVIWPKLIHRQPETHGKSYTVDAKEELAILHHNYEDVTEFMQKAVRYAQSEANELSQAKKPFSLPDAMQKSLTEFVSRYFGDEGYKDGMHGLILALLQMFYYFLVYAYYWENTGHHEEETRTIQQAIHSFFKNGLFNVNHWQNRINIASYGEKLRRKIVNTLLK